MENRHGSNLFDEAKEKHRYVAVVQPQARKITRSSWFVPLCHVQWLLPLLTFCDKHRQQNHTSIAPNKSTNEIRSKNNTVSGTVREGTYLRTITFFCIAFVITNCIIKNNNTGMVTDDNEYLERTKGKYNIIDLPFSRLVPLVYVSTAFIFGVGLIVMFIFSLCICIRSGGTDCNNL